MQRPTVDRDAVMETVTDPRLEPHFFLAGLLAVTLLAAVLLFVFFPGL